MSGETTCPVCGRHFPIWLGAPLTECATGGNQPCAEALAVAHGEAMRRKTCPDAFDANGVILPGQIARVTRAMLAAGLDPFSGRPAWPLRWEDRADA